MHIEQFVMAYKAEQDRIRALLPEGFTSLRPVLRINAEIRDGQSAYVEFNTPVEGKGKRGWLNIARWEGEKDGLSFRREGKTVLISAPFLDLWYQGAGIEGGCPAEKDNDGCFFLGRTPEFRPAETISEHKEFCDCRFAWKFHEGDAAGESSRETLPAHMEKSNREYERKPLTAERAAAIPCFQVLGTYIVRFHRNADI